MATTIRAVFDGEVLRPEEPLALRAATTYVVTVEGEAAHEGSTEAEGEAEEPYALAEVGRLAVDMGIEGAAVRGPWFVYGTVAEDDPDEEYPLTALGRLAVDMGVEDFAARHDWYAHGRLPDPEP